MNLLEAKNITKRYGHIVALDDLSLDIPENMILGLIGPNGSGKTTFINLVTGLTNLDDGDLFLNGERINGCHPEEISRLGVARTFQETRVFRNMTVIENLLVASRNPNRRESTEKARGLLEDVGLLHLSDRYSGSLSFGQQKLLEFARVLMLDPTLILLDESTAGIDPLFIDQLLKWFQTLRHEGKTLVIIEHNIEVINAICERVIVLHAGHKIAEGSPAEIGHDRAVQDAYLGSV
jgi:ABC-type branched-subunit amino acid transport system ATPase component